jgi:hypothetical protein
MKSFYFFTILIFVATIVRGQNDNPVHFEYTILNITKNTYEVHIISKIDRGWHIYSQVQSKKAISVPTVIAFQNNPLIQFKGRPKEIGAVKKQNIAVLDIEQNIFEEQAQFVQVVTLRAKVKTILRGNITYQACTDERCLNPKTERFEIPI